MIALQLQGTREKSYTAFCASRHARTAPTVRESWKKILQGARTKALGTGAVSGMHGTPYFSTARPLARVWMSESLHHAPPRPLGTWWRCTCTVYVSPRCTDKLSDQDYTTRPSNQRFTVSRRRVHDGGGRLWSTSMKTYRRIWSRGRRRTVPSARIFSESEFRFWA